MNFNDYFMLYERQSFLDFKVLADYFLQQLKNKIKTEKVELYNPIPMVFMDDTIGIAFSNRGTGPAKGRAFFKDKIIRLYLNKLIPGRKIEDLNKFLLEEWTRIYPTLVHELVHVFDQNRSYFNHIAPSGKVDDEKYVNSQIELNAHVNQFVMDYLRNPIVARKVELGEIGDAVRLIWHHVQKSNHGLLSWMFEDNRRWLIKTIYQIVNAVHQKQKRSE